MPLFYLLSVSLNSFLYLQPGPHAVHAGDFAQRHGVAERGGRDDAAADAGGEDRASSDRHGAGQPAPLHPGALPLPRRLRLLRHEGAVVVLSKQMNQIRPAEMSDFFG